MPGAGMRPSATRQLLLTCLVAAVLMSQTQAINYCPGSWTQYFDRCLRLFTSTYSYSTANSYCASMSNSAGDRGVLFAPRTRQDLGIFDMQEWVNWDLWVGAVRNASGKFVSTEGREVTNDLFVLGVTEGSGTGLDCACYSTVPGRLNLRSCSNGYYFLCQLPATNNPNTTCSPSYLITPINIDIPFGEDYFTETTGMASNFPLYYYSILQASYQQAYGMTFCGSGNCDSIARDRCYYWRTSEATYPLTSYGNNWRSYEYVCLMDSERTPLLFGIPGKLNVSFSASSFINYARPEYALLNNIFRTGSHRVCKWYREYYGDLDVNLYGDACIPSGAWPAATSKCRTSSLSITCLNAAGNRYNCEVPDCSSRTYSNIDYYSGRGVQNAFSEMFMNKKVKIAYTVDDNGFSTMNTNTYQSTVTADNLYYLLIDLKTATLVTLIIPFSNTAGQLRCLWVGVSNTWNSSLDEAAFNNGWTSCGVQESADPSDGHLFFQCPPGTVAQYVVVTRRKSCGYHIVNSLKIYGDHYYDVNFIPGSSFVNQIPDSMEASLRVNKNITFSTLIRNTYADFFLTHGTSYSTMIDQRIRFRLYGDSSTKVLWISDGYVWNKAVNSTNEIPLTRIFYLNKADTLTQMGPQNVFDFHNLTFTFQFNRSANENFTLSVFIDDTLVGVFADPRNAANFTINSAGFSKKSGDTENTGVVVQFPGVPNSINAGFWQPSFFYGDNQDWHQVAFSTLVWIYYTGYSRGSDSNDQDVGAYYTDRLWSADLIIWNILDSGNPMFVTQTTRVSNFISMKPPKLLLGMRHVEHSYISSFQLKFMLYGKVADDMVGGLQFPYLVSRYNPVTLSALYSGTYPGYRATDGVLNSYCCYSIAIVASTNALRWMYVDMVVSRNFSYVVIYPRNADDGHWHTYRNTEYYGQLTTMGSQPTFASADFCYRMNSHLRPDDQKYYDYFMFPCNKTARYLTVKKNDGIGEYLSLSEIEVYATLHSDPQLNTLSQLPMGLGDYVQYEWMVSGATQNKGGLISLPLSAQETPFVDSALRFNSIGVTTSYVRLYFPISMTVTGVATQGSGKRSAGLRGAPYSFRVRHSPYKDYRRIQDVVDQAGSVISFQTIRITTTIPTINYLPSPIDTQLLEVIMTNSWVTNSWKIEVLGYPAALLRSIISPANYSLTKYTTDTEQVIRIAFNEIFYLTSIRLANLNANDGFYLTYRVTQNGTDRQLRTPWYDNVYNFSSYQSADNFFIPVILTPTLVELHFSINSSVGTSNVVNIRGIEINDECPPGWRPMYNICIRLVPSAMDWNTSLQYCQSRYWNGKNGTLFMPKTALLRNFAHHRNMFFHVGVYKNSTTGNWFWLDGDSVEQGAFYMGQPVKTSCAHLRTDFNGLYKAECTDTLFPLCQIPKKIWSNRKQTVVLNTLYNNYLGAEDDNDAYSMGPTYEMVGMWTLDSGYKYIPSIVDYWDGLNMLTWSVSTGTESMATGSSKASVYYRTQIDHGCMEPLLYPDPGVLGVRVNASSSNSRRGPEKAFLGSVMSKEDHVQCALSRADYVYYDTP